MKTLLIILILILLCNCTTTPNPEPDKYIWVNKQDSTEIYFHPGFIFLPTFLGFCLIAQELNQAHIEKQQKKRGVHPANY